MKTNWIQNADGSIYHLKLKPGDLATTIITVGDPERVSIIGDRLDRIERKINSREFHTISGYLSGQHISILSTGIGTDNIDIAINEIDALFNVDLESGLPKETITKLKIIRMGTSGSIQPDLEVDQILISDWVAGMDNTMNFYNVSAIDLSETNREINGLTHCYLTRADSELLKHFHSSKTVIGNTITAPGFYAPQGRPSRIHQNNLLDHLKKISIPPVGKFSNIEMETSMIYGLAELMGHQAISLNAILANRITGMFSKNPETTITKMIDYGLEKILRLFD